MQNNFDENGNIVGTFYYHENARGDTVALTDANGDVVIRMEYSSYGVAFKVDENNELTGFAESDLVVYTFQGRRLDEETGLMYFRNRYYSAQRGRFVSRDPLGYKDSYGLYESFGGNPYGYSDPLGKKLIFSEKFLKDPRKKKLLLEMISALENVTGLRLGICGETRALQIKGTKNTNGKTSKFAREYMKYIIGMNAKNEGEYDILFEPGEKNRLEQDGLITLNLEELKKRENTVMGKTFGYALTFIHETFHQYGFRDYESLSYLSHINTYEKETTTLETIDIMNIIRLELGTGYYLRYGYSQTYFIDLQEKRSLYDTGQVAFQYQSSKQMMEDIKSAEGFQYVLLRRLPNFIDPIHSQSIIDINKAMLEAYAEKALNVGFAKWDRKMGVKWGNGVIFGTTLDPKD